jgi:hypothetical protein
MQISTRTEDFIVDTLKLRKYLGERLREAFQDPTKKKVLLALSVILFFLLFIPIIQFSISLMTK